MTRRQGIIAALAAVAASFKVQARPQTTSNQRIADTTISTPQAMLQWDIQEGPQPDWSRPKPGTKEKEEKQHRAGYGYALLSDPADYETIDHPIALRVRLGNRVVELTGKEIMDALETK